MRPWLATLLLAALLFGGCFGLGGPDETGLLAVLPIGVLEDDGLVPLRLGQALSEFEAYGMATNPGDADPGAFQSHEGERPESAAGGIYSPPGTSQERIYLFALAFASGSDAIAFLDGPFACSGGPTRLYVRDGSLLIQIVAVNLDGGDASALLATADRAAREALERPGAVDGCAA